MKRSTFVRLVLFSSLAVGPAALLLRAEDETKQITVTPATQPAAEATTKPVSITPEAQKELDALTSAYNKLTALSTTGTVRGEFDVAGEKKSFDATFTSTFQAPNRFRHSTKDDMVLGSTGEKTFLFLPSQNAFYQIDAAKTRTDFAKERSGIALALNEQNHAMLLAMSDPPTKLLLDGASDVTKVDDVKVGDKTCPAVLIKKKHEDVRLAIDPDTHLLRQLQRDMSRDLKERGAPEVKVATVVYEFTNSLNGETKSEQFAWTPPANAKDATQQIGRELLMQAGEQPALQMVGKPAPAFTLTGLDDKKVSLDDLKGKVIVLDFWATWCGPCVAGLPHVDKLYADKKDAGLKVFAVNQAEEKDVVSEFIEKKGLKIPVLLDSDEKVGADYMVDGIPHQVLIGKDGNVKKVMIGFNPNEPDMLRKFVEEELAK